MRAIITDRDALLRVQVPELEQYLKRNGWRLSVTTPKATLWTLEHSAGEQFEIELPLNSKVRDYPIRVSEIFQTLDTVEGRSQLDIFNELQLAGISAQAVAAPMRSASTVLGLPLFTWCLLIISALIAGFVGASIFYAQFSFQSALRPPTGGSGQSAVNWNINTWAMISTVLSLLAIFPGLTSLYAGLVRRKNALSVIAQCWGIMGVVTIIWCFLGYGLVFNTGGSMIGNPCGIFSASGSALSSAYEPGISAQLFPIHQMMFAILAGLIILGAVAERMKFVAILLFMALWVIAVFCPIAHMMWASDGFMNGIANRNATIRAIDFSGGAVVQMTGGWSGLILCLILGPRLGFGKGSMPPHNMVLVVLGTGLLWVGWYGFTAGRTFGSVDVAVNAFSATTLAAIIGGFVWATMEFIFRGKSSVLGFCSGTLAGLVVVTPACGFVTTRGAVLVGLAAGVIPFLACLKLKACLGYDDALDSFGIHGVGGMLGVLMTGLLADGVTNPTIGALVNGLFLQQLLATVVTLLWSVVGTLLIAYMVKAAVGLRPSMHDEVAGLDLVEHGEEGYHGS